MMRIALAAAVLWAVAASGLVTWYRWQNDRLDRHVQRVEAVNAFCLSRQRNILKDKESDDAVDRLPDDDLRSVPDVWMRE